MRKQKQVLRFLAMILAAMLIVLNCNSACSITTYAASASSFEQVKKLLPIGTTLRSDSFPGLRILFDGKESCDIGNGANALNISVEITDLELAKKSLPAVRFIFGPLAIEMKVGAKTAVKSTVSGVTADRYKALVSSLGDAKLSKLLNQLLEKDTLAADSLSLFSDFVVALSTANEYETFIEAVEKAEEIAAEEARVRAENEAAQITPAASKSEDGSSSSDKSNKDSDDDEINGSGGGGSSSDGSGGGGSFPDDSAKVDTYRTIMIFLNGTDLESNSENATKNLLDLLSVKIPDNTRVFITTGGTEKWHMNDKAAYKTYAKNKLYPNLLESDLDKPENVGKKNEIASLADDYYKKYSTNIGSNIQIYEVSKGENNKLTLLKEIPDRYFLEHSYISEFIDYVVENSSSPKYDLIMWDHGNGIKGYGGDQIYKAAIEKNASLKRNDVEYTNIESLKKAIAESQIIKSGRKFDFIGFDACQMATVEVATDLMDLADYLILSEEDEPGAGWDYSKWMSSLNSNPEMETTELGKAIVDSFIDQYKTIDDNVTLGVIQTDKLAEVDNALSEFLEYLVRDYLESEYHEAILEVIGKIGDFGTRYGDERQGLVDICHLCRPFLNEEKDYWSQDLVEASEDLYNAIQDAVITAKGTKGINNNGLSINLPLNVYTYTYAGRTDDGEETYNYTYGGKDTVEVLNKLDINPDIKKAYAQIALNRLAANVVGDMWLYDEVTAATVAETLTSADDAYKAKEIIAASGADLKDENDSVRVSFDHLVEHRVAISNASIVYGEDGQGNAADSSVAYIVLENVSPAVVDDLVSVNVVLKDGNNEYPLGTTPLYSVSENTDQAADSMSWKIKKFDNKWYTINEQISDFFVTNYDSESNTYTGYVILGRWENVEDVAGNDEQDRTDYVCDRVDEGDISVIHLNVKGQYNPESGETVGLSPINYEITQNDEPASISYPVTDLENCYLEILSSRGSTINSLGTVYASIDPTQPSAGLLKLDVRTIMDLQPSYAVSDIYGVTYEFSDKGLRNAADEEKVKSLDSFTEQPVAEEALTFEQSLQLAAEVRQTAAEEAENQDDDDADDEDDDDEDGDDEDGDGDDGDGDDGDDQQGDDQQGDDQQGDDQQGEDQQGYDQQGDDQQGDDQQGDDQQGDDQQGDDQQGDDQQGDAQQGDAQQGDDQQGDAQQGEDQQGDAQQGDDQQGDAQQGDGQDGGDQQGDGQDG